jgi:oxygen-independent coproporphyrinogen-3 oxidase
LRSALSIEGSAEVTVELNPDDVDGPLLGMLADLGVSRISLGVQSFDDRALRWLGRRHDASGAHRALEAVRAAGFAGVGIDLMFGWPGQRVRDWLRELAVALAYAPSHLSCYELTLEPQTPLRRAVEARGEDVGADPARRRALYLAGANRLRGLGWDHYEVSNYARTPRHRSRHNAKYWRHVSYLGLGPSAHSLHARRRWWNLRDLDGYLAAARGGAMPPRGGERLDDEAWRLEAVMLGMRTAEGVSCATLQEVPGVQRALQALVREGLVVVRDEQIRPSLMGFLVADSLPLRFAL